MRRLTAALVALIMLFTAQMCALAETPTQGDAEPELTREQLIDALEAAERTIQELRAELDAYKNPDIVARFNGGVIYANEVMEQFNEILELYELFYGYDLTLDPEQCANIQADIIVSLAADAIIALKLSEADVELLSEEALADISAEARSVYEQLLGEYLENFRFADMSEEDVIRDTELFLANNGYNEQTLYDDYLEMAKQEATISYIAGNIELTDDMIYAAYLRQIEEDKAYYELSPDEYEYETMYGDAGAAWIPEGYRRIRVLLIAFTNEQIERLDELYAQFVLCADDAETASVQAMIDECYSALNARVDEVRARIEQGDAFDALLAEYGEDPAMTQEPFLTEGYCVYKDSFYFEKAITDAAMALENVGDVSDAIRGEYGVSFVEYFAPVPSGEVPLDQISDSVARNLMSELRYERYMSTVDAWLEEANLIMYLDRLN